MIATNHGLTGAAIGIALSSNPVLALPLAFASHFALDALPHSGFDDLGGHLKVPKKLFYSTLVLDSLLLFLTFVFLVAQGAPWLVYACWFLAGSPDFAWAYRYVFKEKLGRVKPAPMNRLNRFHSHIQWSQTRIGWLVEIPFLIVMFYYVSQNL